MGKELILVDGDRLADRLALRLCRRGSLTSGGQIALHLCGADPLVHTKRGEDRPGIGDRLVGAPEPPESPLITFMPPLPKIPPLIPARHSGHQGALPLRGTPIETEEFAEERSQQRCVAARC
jgi:hypothetical protein